MVLHVTLEYTVPHTGSTTAHLRRLGQGPRCSSTNLTQNPEPYILPHMGFTTALTHGGLGRVRSAHSCARDVALNTEICIASHHEVTGALAHGGPAVTPYATQSRV